MRLNIIICTHSVYEINISYKKWKCDYFSDYQSIVLVISITKKPNDSYIELFSDTNKITRYAIGNKFKHVFCTHITRIFHQSFDYIHMI